MDALAGWLGQQIAELPTLRGFILGGLAVLAALAGATFAVRNTGWFRLLAAGMDRLLTWLVAALLLSMVFLSGLQILLRNAFDSGLPWIDPLLRHLVLFLALTGAILATGLKRHVQINVLGRLMRGMAGKISGALVATLAAVVLLALSHGALELLRDELDFGEVVFLHVPSWLVVLTFPVAFLAMAYRSVLLAFEEIAGVAPPAADVEIEGLEGGREETA